MFAPSIHPRIENFIDNLFDLIDSTSRAGTRNCCLSTPHFIRTTQFGFGTSIFIRNKKFPLPTVFTYVLSDLLPKIGGLRASTELHRILLANIMRLPMTFYWVNPTGRILVRFSKDIDVVDGPLPRQLDSLAFFALQVQAKHAPARNPLGSINQKTIFQSREAQLTSRCSAN